MSLELLGREMIPALWPMIEPMVQLAVDKSNGEMTSESVKTRLIDGNMAMAIVLEGETVVAAITFEQREFETGKRILSVATAGGSSACDWIDEVNDLCEALAVKYKCDEIYIIGRPGWVKKLKHLDYSLVHTVISRKVGV